MIFNKIKIRHIIFLILVILACITIFHFSNEVSKASRSSSGKVAEFVINTFFKNSTDAEKKQLKDNIIEPLARKIAHYTLYTLLGFFTMNYALTCKGSLYQKGLSSFIFTLLYAVSDEIHQLYVPGRSCEFRDVCIDSLGSVTGILIATSIVLVVRKILKKNIESKKIDKNSKILFISSTGGHFSELLQLKPIMDKCNYYIVTEKTKNNKDLKEKYKEKFSFLLYETKKHPFKYIFVLLANCFISLYVYLKFRPQIVITTGTHTAGPMCCIAKILGSKVIYIETFANRKTKTVTGRFLYLIADTFIVQWDEMLKLYPNAKNFGWIY